MKTRLLAVGLVLALSTHALAQGRAAYGKAPELEGGNGWLNTDKPITLAELKGKIIMLDFWTHCCINCMHVIPDLIRLEKKYPKELVVIGVHSAKFKNEQDTDTIRQAILRYDIEHPVVNDSEFKIWNKYGPRGWPHFTMIGPDGVIYKHYSGEGNYENFVAGVEDLLKKHGDKINRTELKLGLERNKVKPGALAFPGKILATVDRLYIADTKHHRIVVADHAGKILETIGGKEEGNKDGSFAAARFDEPQGLALRENTLYVCDRQNHTIRQVDLAAKTVKTIAGTGTQGSHLPGGEALKVALNSPWDLALDGGRLFIAMAGNHQIWVLSFATGMIQPFSGTGRENIADGPHARALFSQPSGLSIQGGKVYVADSEISAVREVDLDPTGGVRTLVGTGLFDFGDKDGVGSEALLQHCIGLGWHKGVLYVTDSYNHKIKTIDPKTRAVKTFLGDGRKGLEDGAKPRFHEPSGVAGWGDKLFIADTNNHAIRVCDPKTGAVSTLKIE
jgi:thiol-disulfide isomerase/thioredoxin